MIPLHVGREYCSQYEHYYTDAIWSYGYQYPIAWVSRNWDEELKNEVLITLLEAVASD